VRKLANNIIGKNEKVKGITTANQHCHREVAQSVHRSIPETVL
jgi:hypothetical protein